MKRDIRSTKLYGQIESYFQAIHAPGERMPTDAEETSVSQDGCSVAFTGTVFSDLTSVPETGIYLVDVESGKIDQICKTKHSNDRLPRWSPDGTKLAFLSDRRGTGEQQLYLAREVNQWRPEETPVVDGFVEYLHWSPDGTKVLLGVAGGGADLAGCQGGMTTAAKEGPLPGWIPEVDSGNAENLWRSIYIYNLDLGETTKILSDDLNIWESNWMGNDDIVAIVSNSHSEGSWYKSRLVTQSIRDCRCKNLYTPEDQIGLPCSSPSGRQIAFVEAVCSDRLIVCGRLKLIEHLSGVIKTVDTAGIEITDLHWRNDFTLLIAGHRGAETIVADINVKSESVSIIWSGEERTFGVWYPSVSVMTNGGAIGIGESYNVAPELVYLNDGDYKIIRSFASNQSADSNFPRPTIHSITWKARDDLDIQGWLVLPEGKGPFPLVMDIHGGPVWLCRNRWAGRLRGAKVLADYGVASLYPNPRGSSGRGQDFTRLVKGDMGGEDTYDYLTACDSLVERGIADPDRLGVTGISYGGFASAWLITQDSRFAAAVPISPVCNWYSHYRTSQIPFFDSYFLDGSAYESGGKFFERSPVMFTANVSTPTLLLTGDKDQNTPPTQALEFHRSLLEHGVRSELATYPTAGHGIRSYPEVIDATTRYVSWFLEHFDIPIDEENSH